MSIAAHVMSIAAGAKERRWRYPLLSSCFEGLFLRFSIAALNETT